MGTVACVASILLYNCYSMARHNGKIYERKVAPLLIVIVYPLDAHTHTHTHTLSHPHNETAPVAVR